MINVETLKLLSVIKRLQEELQSGVVDFNDLKGETDSLVIDGKWVNGRCGVVCDYLIDELHHDIICLYSDLLEDVRIEFVDDDDDEWIEIFIYDNDSIVVEPNNWYFSNY